MKYIYARRSFDGMLCRFDNEAARKAYMRDACGDYETITRSDFTKHKRARYTRPRWIKCAELFPGAALLVNF